tara:strand:- start:2047 stop:2910 length:864 start_codon:yes stop_codon:yes gene_type:complete
MRVRHIRDFRDILAGYDDTANLSRSDWAWEFLRRNGRLQTNAMVHIPGFVVDECSSCVTRLRLARRDRLAETWGLLAFPDPNLPARLVDVFWSDRAFPRKISVLGRERATDEADELFDLAVRHCRITHLTDAVGHEHVLIRGRRGTIQIRYRGLPLFGEQPIKLDVSLAKVSRLGDQARVLDQARRMIGCDQTGPQAWTRKGLGLRNALIALDANGAGLSYRDMAMIFYGEPRVSAAWRSHSTAMKSEMARLLAKGRRLRDGGYFGLLHGRSPVSPGRGQTTKPGSG